jgi:hypothetical protein
MSWATAAGSSGTAVATELGATPVGSGTGGEALAVVIPTKKAAANETMMAISDLIGGPSRVGIRTIRSAICARHRRSWRVIRPT